jgi:hypothetical protein
VSSSKKPDFRGIPTRIARFVSPVRAGVPWHDVHLPLTPVYGTSGLLYPANLG